MDFSLVIVTEEGSFCWCPDRVPLSAMKDMGTLLQVRNTSLVKGHRQIGVRFREAVNLQERAAHDRPGLFNCLLEFRNYCCCIMLEGILKSQLIPLVEGRYFSRHLRCVDVWKPAWPSAVRAVLHRKRHIMAAIRFST